MSPTVALLKLYLIIYTQRKVTNRARALQTRSMHACRVRADVHSALSLASMRGACASCAHGWPSSTSRWIDRFPDPRELLCWLSTMNNMTAATGTMIVVATPLNKQIARLHCQLGVLLHMLHFEKKNYCICYAR